MGSIASELWSIEQSLAQEVINLDFADSNVKYILNPLDYCEDPHLQYLNKYLTDLSLSSSSVSIPESGAWDKPGSPLVK